MNFIKKLVGEKQDQDNGCCGVVIKEVEGKEDSCCGSEKEDNNCCVEHSEY